MAVLRHEEPNPGSAKLPAVRARHRAMLPLSFPVEAGKDLLLTLLQQPLLCASIPPPPSTKDICACSGTLCLCSEAHQGQEPSA